MLVSFRGGTNKGGVYDIAPSLAHLVVQKAGSRQTHTPTVSHSPLIILKKKKNGRSKMKNNFLPLYSAAGPYEEHCCAG